MTSATRAKNSGLCEASRLLQREIIFAEILYDRALCATNCRQERCDVDAAGEFCVLRTNCRQYAEGGRNKQHQPLILLFRQPDGLGGRFDCHVKRSGDLDRLAGDAQGFKGKALLHGCGGQSGDGILGVIG